ncbi:DUF4860 domain-containing protein [Blautia sp. An46]|uniref:DUF4860 domain-containing protein n=1 Tax=Blautia sp. An46 TaxID=1965636 RepID=UPI000B36DA30|nr:DUF4860 domain-containing protein [Blautia sp. An46]OUN94551.1 hypothetical protein B5G00_03365 [Blautia sp. An46]
MNRYFRKRHSIDLIFTISLFCVFALSSLGVTAAGAVLYQRTVREERSDYNLYTALSYIEQKLKSCDQEGGVSLEEGETGNLLCIHQSIGGISYRTYIYAYEGSLMELFIRTDQEPDFSGGTPLLEIQDMEVSVTGQGLLSLTVTERSGNSQSLLWHPETIETGGDLS